MFMNFFTSPLEQFQVLPAFSLYMGFIDFSLTNETMIILVLIILFLLVFFHSLIIRSSRVSIPIFIGWLRLFFIRFLATFLQIHLQVLQVYIYMYRFASRWLFSTNHKKISILYLCFGSFCILLGIVLFFLIERELLPPVNEIYWSNYNLRDLCNLGDWCLENSDFFLMFFIILPLFFGAIGNYKVLYLIRDKEIISFPRTNLLAFWFLPLSLIFFMLSILVENGAGIGWTVYPPLSSIGSDKSLASFFAVLSLHFACISYILTSFNFLFTCIFTIRSMIRFWRPFWVCFFLYFDRYNSFIVIVAIWLLFWVPIFIVNPEVLVFYNMN